LRNWEPFLSDCCEIPLPPCPPLQVFALDVFFFGSLVFLYGSGAPARDIGKPPFPPRAISFSTVFFPSGLLRDTGPSTRYFFQSSHPPPCEVRPPILIDCGLFPSSVPHAAHWLQLPGLSVGFLSFPPPSEVSRIESDLFPLLIAFSSG